MAMLGLRGKSLVALLLVCVLALIPAVLVAWQGISAVRDHFGLAYARNTTLLNRQKLLTPILRELALSQRLADSTVTRDWLRDSANPEKRERFFREAEGYRHDFRDHSYFVIDGGPDYYFNDGNVADAQRGRYRLSRSEPKDAWFFEGLRDPAPYAIQVDVNSHTGLAKVWFNVQVRDGDDRLGLVGTGLDLTTFLRDFVGGAEAGLTPVIVDEAGAIQVHADPDLIAYKSMSPEEAARRSIFGQLPREADRAALRAAMEQASARPGETFDLRVDYQGEPRLLVLSYLPELRWHLMTIVDFNVAHIVDMRWLEPALIALALLLALLLLGFGYAVDRLVLQPLRRLQQTAQAISAGRYDAVLPAGGRDEIGELSRSFGVMADKVRTHTEELESRVAERTRALEEANRRMAAAHKAVEDSIDYASLIQRAILPNRQMVQSLGEHHFVLWHPRDVVGGDFYVFRADGENCLLGVVDCAGHGVPGALMTMLARAAIDHAINEAGVHDPAAILAATDTAMRGMLRDAELPRALATNMDAGLAYVDRAAGRLRFSGAKMSLYAGDGRSIEEIKGGRRALGEKRPGDYFNTEVDLAGRTFYLLSDGILDQAGGEHGYGFGNRRLLELLASIADLPLALQADALHRALSEYQGGRPQRDDITVLSFRFV
ncbi:biofilm regulation protein phosphatase SiaA [Pigmentiphaga soli]|uniref:Biofilm regulation protein phosphatase SiaA n=1 Tax=Pigmentiphaga soli TaxID=1007095 RepID=A0ABP8GR25_9BURK